MGLQKRLCARCYVGLRTHTAKECRPILARGEEEVFCIRPTAIMLETSLVEAVVRRDNQHGLICYAEPAECRYESAQFLIVDHQALGVGLTILSYSVPLSVRLLVVNPQEER
jgi:hypothetical protein